MNKQAGRMGKGVVLGALGMLALLSVLGLLVVHTGAYNVAATEPHTALTRWAFDTALHSAVRQRSRELPRPAEELTPARLAAGAQEYKAMCQQCHGGPGAQRAMWASDMRPQPPLLAEAAAEWEPGEIFWIAKHGIRMTGMPAFGPTHDDRTLWNIVGFVRQLPGMTPERYAMLGGSAGSGGHGSGGAGHHGSGGADHHGNGADHHGSGADHGNDGGAGAHRHDGNTAGAPHGGRSPGAHAAPADAAAPAGAASQAGRR